MLSANNEKDFIEREELNDSCEKMFWSLFLLV